MALNWNQRWNSYHQCGSCFKNVKASCLLANVYGKLNPALSRGNSRCMHNSFRGRTGGMCKRGGRRLLEGPCAFQIDHRYHMEKAWERQEKALKLLENVANDVRKPDILHVSDLCHLEAILEAVGGQLVILYLHSRSCGICKEIRRGYTELCNDSHAQRAGIVFLEHDIYDEFDYISDLARFYRLKAAPRFVFFVDGAVKQSVALPDIRRLSSRGGHIGVADIVHGQQQKLKATLWELLVKNAPSARK